MESSKFNIKWSTSVKVITIIGNVISFFPLLGMLFLPTDLFFIFIVFLSFIPLFFVFIYAFFKSPITLELSETQIIVHKRKGVKIIDYNQILKTEIYKPDKSDIRTFGVGGIFGFFGDFKNSKIGNYQAYVGDFKQAFLIQTKEGKNYVVSCENRDLAMEIITKNIKK